MAIRHILKDGTVLTDITGHVVKIEDAKVAYQIMDKLNEERMRKHDGRDNNGKMA
jgi:hypothetical protein